MTREGQQRYMEGFGSALLMDDYAFYEEDAYHLDEVGGPAAGVSAVASVFTAGAQAVGGLIALGFETEYHPKRRMKVAADLVPRYMRGIEKMQAAQVRAARKAKAWEKKKNKKCRNKFKRGPLKGKPKDPLGCKRMKRKVSRYKKLARRIQKGRKLLFPSPLFGLPMPISPRIDDTLNMKIYADMLHKAGWNLPGGGPGGKAPIHADGGNITTTRGILEPLFIEALIFSLMPEAAVMNDPQMRGARDSALAAVDTALRKPGGLRRIFGPTKDTKAGKLPKTLRNKILKSLVEWHGMGMIPDNMPLPPWVFGYPADGSKDPDPLPTMGAYLALNEAIAQGRLNDEIINRLKGKRA